jgi:hypothetical protein
VVLESEDLEALGQEVKSLLMGVKGAFPVANGAKGEAEFAGFKLEGSKVYEKGRVVGFGVWGGC